MSHRIVLVAFLSSVLFAACSDSKAQSLKKQFKENTSYFMALDALEKSDEKVALRLFKESRAKSSPKIARLSALELTKLGNVTERTKAADYLAKKYDDEQSLTVAAEVFFEQGEYSRILSITAKIDLKTASNKLANFRIESLNKKNDSRFEEEFFAWFLARPLSSFHLNNFQTYSKKYEAQKEENEEVAAKFSILNYRILVHKKNYKAAFDEIKNILDSYKFLNRSLDYQILSDMGKAALYGTDDFRTSAKKFESLAKTLEGEQAYCAYFYAARLYDRAGRYQDLTQKNFKAALEVIDDGEKFDNCLWYLLNMQLRTSTDDIIATLKKYAHRISDSAYFDDFFDNFSVLLLSHAKWQDFYDVWKMIDGFASETASCKYAYIAGRILEEGFGKTDGTPKTKEAVAAYTRVLKGNSDIYYKVCSIQRMNIIDPNYVKNILCTGGTVPQIQVDSEAGILLAGYAAFGFPQKIYPVWISERKTLSLESSIQAGRFLNQCGIFKNEYSVQSLRISSRTRNFWGGTIPLELLELTYPRFYSNFVEKSCAENSIQEHILYALIRSESFFDSTVSSKAGANGLTQLMKSTADDEARKLKLGENYNILDPETNIKIGSHYFASLVERTEGKSELLAMLAYNAGLTNVRKWKNATSLPMDFYLETLPFQETREYGRKMVGAAAMYGFLYYGITPAETVSHLLKL